MSLTRADAALAAAGDELWLAVSELAVTVHEDRPAASDLAVVDDLAERVSELQGTAHQIRELCRSGQVLQMPARLDAIAALADAAETYYWHALRSHDPVAKLRAASRGRGDEWLAWRRSVEDAVRRCEPPLGELAGALRVAWHEVGALLSLGMVGTNATFDFNAQSTDNPRRPS